MNTSRNLYINYGCLNYTKWIESYSSNIRIIQESNKTTAVYKSKLNPSEFEVCIKFNLQQITISFIQIWVINLLDKNNWIMCHFKHQQINKNHKFIYRQNCLTQALVVWKWSMSVIKPCVWKRSSISFWHMALNRQWPVSHH